MKSWWNLSGYLASARSGSWNCLRPGTPRTTGAGTGVEDWLDVVTEVTGILWDDVMGPITAAVSLATERSEGPGQLVLLPTGLLSLLPWHAAWAEDRDAATGRRYLLDDFVVTYAAGARAINAAVAAATVAAGRRADGCLVIENPDGTLHYAPQEAEAVSSDSSGGHHPAPERFGSERARVLAALPDYPVLHFATHGRSGWLDPLQSELVLAGEQHLTLPDLLALRLEKGRLAVLSACESGVPGTDLPDEMAGLPAGFQQAGLAGVVASAVGGQRPEHRHADGALLPAVASGRAGAGRGAARGANLAARHDQPGEG